VSPFYHVEPAAAASPKYPPANVGNSFSAVKSIPQNSESAVWSFDPVTLAITPQWVNTGLSHPITIIVYTQETLLFTGDFTAFVNNVGPSQRLVRLDTCC
jgi:hypothetical protein